MSEIIRYSDAELEEFRQLIQKKLDKDRNEYEQLKASINNIDGNDVMDTSPIFKVFELGTNKSSAFSGFDMLKLDNGV